MTVCMRFALLLIGISWCSAAAAQLNVEADQTVQWYVENVLLGEGVQASNITFNGAPADQVNLQCGYFESNGSYVELESGMVLSTGHVYGVDFFGDSVFVGSTTTIFVDSPTNGDVDLQTLSDEDIFDQAVLEFDFIPTGDTLRFNYIFGSEEYPEFVNSFNDAFGFFLAGPGITGPFSSPAGFPNGSTNIALVPGTTTPVTIDNVNEGNFNCPGNGTECTNCEYYVNNCDIADVALDGTTTVLEAFSLVQCGETYHIKLAIGDALDGSWDSAVFLQEGSFQSSLAISAGLFSSIGPDLDGILYENCGFGTLSFSRSTALDTEATVEIVLDGVAENGVDFTTIPSTFIFAPGDSIITFNVSAIIDGLDEGVEEVTLTITNTSNSACGGNVTSEFVFYVSDDPEPLQVSTQDYSIDCGEEATFDVQVTGGYGQYNYNWTPDLPNMPNPTVSPGFTTEYQLLVTDTCNSIETATEILVTVPVYPEVVVEAPDEVQLVCLEEVTLSPDNVSGGNGSYTFNWFENGEILGTLPTLNYIGGISSTVVIQAVDGCGTTAEDYISIIVPDIPMSIVSTVDTVICLGDDLTLATDVSGGEGPYNYFWSNGDNSGPETTVAPEENTIYNVIATDRCGQTISDAIEVEVSEVAAGFFVEIGGYYKVTLNDRSTSSASDSLIYSWDFDDGEFSSEANPVHQYFDLSDHTITLTVIDEYGCTATSSSDVSAPSTIYVPTAFSPNGDGINDYFRVVGNSIEDFEMSIYNRWGQRVFFSNDVDEGWSGAGAQDSDYYSGNTAFSYTITARASDGARYELEGTIAIFR